MIFCYRCGHAIAHGDHIVAIREWDSEVEGPGLTESWSHLHCFGRPADLEGL